MDCFDDDDSRPMRGVLLALLFSLLVWLLLGAAWTFAAHAQSPGRITGHTGFPAAVPDATPTPLLGDKYGRAVSLPYAMGDAWAWGTGSTAAAATVTLIASPGASLALYVTGLQCGNTGATTSMVTLNDGVASAFINPAGFGTNIRFTPPLKLAANTALTMTTGAASTTQTCNAQGYAAP